MPQLAGTNINIAELARQLGMDKSYLYRILKGTRPVEQLSIGHARVIATALGMTIDELVAAIRQA